MSEPTGVPGGPAEPAPPASSQTPDMDAPATPATGDGGGARTRNLLGAVGQFFTNNAPLLIFALVALAFVLSLVSIFWPYIAAPPRLDKTLLQLLADTETARGLITFLVAVATVGIALILIVYLATSSETTDALKERFAFSKEVLTSLIGILGTIIGFYFGASQDQTRGHGASTTLTLTNLDIIPPKPGTDGTVRATLSSGQSPYTYEIRLMQDTKTIKKFGDQAPGGTISQPVKLDDYDPAKPLDITLEGWDATGAISGKHLHLPATPSPGTQIPSANKMR